MAIIHILGGSGFTGGLIAAEAARRGHDVTAISRRTPADPIEGVRYVAADLTDADALAAATEGADAVVGALSPRGDMVGRVGAVYARVASDAARTDARFIVIGGFGSLRPAEGAPRIFESPDFPAEYVEESRELGAVLEELENSPDSLDWVYVSPPLIYGAHADLPVTGRYGVGGAIATALSPGDAGSAISGEDLARAVVDELENPQHHRVHLSVTG